jgi:hypothetical protein
MAVVVTIHRAERRYISESEGYSLWAEIEILPPGAAELDADLDPTAATTAGKLPADTCRAVALPIAEAQRALIEGGG